MGFIVEQYQNNVNKGDPLRIKARTEYTKELVVSFVRFSFYNPISRLIPYIIIELFMILYTALNFFPPVLKGEASAFVAIPAIVLILFVPFVLFIAPILMVKTSRGIIGGVNTFEFLNNEIMIDSALPHVASQTKMNYHALFRVYETKNVFYLFTSKSHALIVRKADIFDGSVSDLRSLFLKNIPAKKYKTRGVKKTATP